MDIVDAKPVELHLFWDPLKKKLQRSLSLPGKFNENEQMESSDEETSGIFQSDYDQDNYNMSHEKRGIAIVINVDCFKNGDELTREGSTKDDFRIKNVLKTLNFDVMSPENNKKKTIRKIIKKVSQMDHSKFDCFLLIMMTHGEKNGKLEASDGTIKIEELWDNFMGDECKSLVGKPKLFFVQACRGEKFDKAVFVKRDVVDAKGKTNNLISLPSSADQLIMYATSEGFVAMRNTSEGSWLIQELCNQLETNSTDDLMSMLTVVNRKVAMRAVKSSTDKNLIGTKQMPIIVSSLTKKIYFHTQPDHDTGATAEEINLSITVA